jgi:predicted alpha/beta superfamily hydrolase
VEFALQSLAIDNDARVYITGNLPELGNWDPSKVLMQPKGDHTWVHKIKCKSAFPLEYKYTLGSWQREGAEPDGRPLRNLTAQSKKDVVIRDRIEFWTTGEARPVLGQITGTVRYHRQLKTDGILPRDIIVWLPPNYDESRDRYPVLYMHDGQNIIDPKTSAFGVDWQIDEACTRLIETGKIRPLIIVGINNTSERTREYVPGETGDAYARFIISVVKPLIDEQYRTKSDRQHTAIGGSSAGGLCAFRMAWDHPDIFSKAICMSPAFRYRGPDGSWSINYVDEFAESKRPEPTPFFYIDNGGIGMEQLLQEGIDRILEAMEHKGLVAERNYVWKLYSDARHDESAWARRFPVAVQLLFEPGSN